MYRSSKHLALWAAIALLWSCTPQEITPFNGTAGSETSTGSGGTGTAGSTASSTSAGSTTGSGSNATTTSGTTTGTTGTTTGYTAPSTFNQGLFRGQDSRIYQRNGWYYYTGFVGDELKLFKYKSLVDQGVGAAYPTAMNNTLFAPIYIGTLNGTTYNAWYIFGPSIWVCNCTDPYDDIAQWQVAFSDVPFPASGFDFEVFQNPQPGNYQNKWYLLGVASIPNGWQENIYISEIISLTPGTTPLSTFNNVPSDTSNLIVAYGSDWTDGIVEAPGVAINGTSVSVAYSGNGTDSDNYAVGLTILQMGQDPTLSGSWINYSQGGCDGDVHDSPEFAQTSDVFGPGVARFTKSADGTQDWMMFASKIFNTPTDSYNEDYTRYLSLQPFSWQLVTCGGEAYSIPNMGTPQGPGTSNNLPAGDIGVQPKTGNFRIEAEYMMPFGYILGPSIQNISTSNTMVLEIYGNGYSSEAYMGNFDALANDETTTPKTSGLILYNAPPGSGLVVASASVAAGSFDLYLNGNLIMTLDLPATGGATTFQETTFNNVTIPAGAQLQLVYQQGKNAAANLDYIEIIP